MADAKERLRTARIIYKVVKATARLSNDGGPELTRQALTIVRDEAWLEQDRASKDLVYKKKLKKTYWMPLSDPAA